MRHPLLTLTLLLFALPISAAPDTKTAANSAPPASVTATADLGQKLAYLRVTNLAENLPAIRAALTAHDALVIDLRGVAANLATARQFRDALLPAAGRQRTARILLINANTASAIPFALGSGLAENGIPGVLAIAPSDYQLPIDLKAPGDSDADRLACEALASGAAPATLLNHQPEKQRYDEAVLVQEYENHGAAEPAETDDSEKPPATNANTPTAKPPPPLTDPVLQLAVNVHRALLALKKL